MFEMSLLDTVLTVLGIIVAMALISCLCCLSMKLSDRRMKSYIIKMADKKGIPVNLETLNPKTVNQSPQSNENCTIMVPDSLRTQRAFCVLRAAFFCLDQSACANRCRNEPRQKPGPIRQKNAARRTQNALCVRRLLTLKTAENK